MRRLMHWRLPVACALAVVALSALASAGRAPQSPTTGYVDPTSSTFNSSRPMVACSSSCSSALVNQNTDALQAAINLAGAGTHPYVYLPAGEYPIARGGTSHNQIYGARINALSQVVIVGYGATLRATGDLGTGNYVMLRLEGATSNVRIYGLTFSQRDLTHSPVPEQTHMLQIGDGSAVAIDNVQVVDCRFIDGQGGDAIRLLGGNTEAASDQRVVIQRNWIDGQRSGVSYQHGTSKIAIVDNYFGTGCSDQSIDHESTSLGGNSHENVIGNTFDRLPNISPTISVGGYGEEDTSRARANYNVWARNVFENGSVQGLGQKAFWFVDNVVHNATTGFCQPILSLFRNVEDTWIDGNTLLQDCDTATNPQLISSTNNNGFAPFTTWVRRNTLEEFIGGTISAVLLTSVRDFWFTGNLLSYRGSSDNTLRAVSATSEGTLYGNSTPAYSAGIIAGNVFRRDVLADDTTTAGRIGIAINTSTGSTSQKIGHLVVRDNYVDGAVQAFQAFQSGSAPFAEGSPVLYSGNQVRNFTSTGLPTNYQINRVPGGESFEDDAELSPSRPSRVQGNCADEQFTLPDGAQDGYVKEIVVYAGCTSTGTVTPDNFGDGTNFEWLVNNVTPTARARLAWDAAGGKWWLLDHSNITVNP